MRNLEDIMNHYDLKEEGLLQEEAMTGKEREAILNKTLMKAGIMQESQNAQNPQDTQAVQGLQTEDEFYHRSYRSDQAPQKVKKLPQRKKWALAVACVLILAMATVSFAAIAMDKDFLNFFHPKDEQQMESLSNLGAIIDKQVTDNGLTLHVKEAIGDKNTVYVLFDIIAPEGTVLNEDYYSFSQTHIRLAEQPGGAGYYYSMMEDDDPKDNKITMVLCYSSEDNLTGNTMIFDLQNLTTTKSTEEIAAIEQLPPRSEPGTPGDEYDYNKVLAYGNLELEFPLNYQDNSTIIKPDADVTMYGGNCKIKEVRYSPLSVTMTVKGNSIKQYDNMPPEDGASGTADGEIQVKLKDGTNVEIESTSTTTKGNKSVIGCQFKEIIDPANIASIMFSGTTIPIE